MPLCCKAWVSPTNTKCEGFCLSAYCEVMESLVQITSLSALRNIPRLYSCLLASPVKLRLPVSHKWRSSVQELTLVYNCSYRTITYQVSMLQELDIFSTLSWILLTYRQTTFPVLSYLTSPVILSWQKPVFVAVSEDSSQRKLSWLSGTSLRQTFVQFYIHLFFSQLFSVLDKECDASA